MHNVINRPHMLMAHPNGRTVIMAGTPGYGLTGGGMLFWDRETSKHILLEHTDLLPEHSTMSLAPLPDDKLLGGSTVGAGTGGEQKAEVAELFIMDIASKAIEWHEPVFPGVNSYTDLCVSPSGLIYGIADQRKFFVFDAEQRTVVHEQDLGEDLGRTNRQQGPRVFVLDTSTETVYILFRKGVAKVEENYSITMLAESPVPIGPGGDILDGKIYFGSSSHLYSYQVPGA